MATISKEQKKQIDQARRRIERRFKQYSALEEKFAEKARVHAPVLNLPSQEEVYKRIDPSRNDWAKQIESMGSIDVYQPQVYKKLKSKMKRKGIEIPMAGKVKNFDIEEALKLMRAANKGYNKSKAEGIKEPRYTPLRNIILIEEDTIKKLGESEGEKETKRRNIYLKRLRNKIKRELSPVNKELANEIIEKLDDLIAGNLEGKFIDMPEMALGDELSALLIDANEAELRNTAKALDEADLGDFVSGLGEIVGYELWSSKLENLVTALGIKSDEYREDITTKNKTPTWHGKTLQEIAAGIKPTKAKRRKKK